MKEGGGEGVCLQAFPSFLPHPLPALLLAPLFSWSLTLVPRSFLLNRTETLATQASGFQNPRVCLQAFPSFLPTPLPTLLLVPFFARSLTLVPRSLLLNHTETLATQAKSFRALGSLQFSLEHSLANTIF